MLGKYVRVRVTNPIHSVNGQRGFTYGLNYGIIEGKKHFDSTPSGAYIMGINHPVRAFDGRVIAVIRHNDGTPPAYVVAPKSTRFINHQVEDAVQFAEEGTIKKIDCLYERSCGAIVYRFIGGELVFLLIKNSRSSNWGFPKGHVERGETNKDTARREVLEETGIHITILPDFASKSEYTIQGKVEKAVTIFLAKTNDVNTKIQQEEIADYAWLNFNKAMDRLKFSNDRNMLKNANDFLKTQGIAV
ncbi:MAG: NUDIX domain-containing protein [Clostridia bacterium]|nr:NUDIX domain-containing protein [Clostridia bacterium]